MGIFSVLGNIVGSIFGNRSEEKMEKRRINAEFDARQQSRGQFLADRQNERQYVKRVTAQDRRYAERMTAEDRSYLGRQTRSDRRYAEKLLFGERDYNRKINLEDRAYNNRMLGRDRKYAERIYQQERRDLSKSKRSDLIMYRQDRRKMQALADKQAIRTAASRGIDFARLRDDAVKAGFNPVTAMQWASAYSTEKGFGVMGDAYSGSASAPSHVIPGRAAGGAGGGSGGAGAVPSSSTSTPVVGSIMPGSNGFQTSGGGYGGASVTPAFMSADLGASIGEAIDTGLNWFSHKDDWKYQAIADQVARGQLAREYSRQTPRNFGYDLSKIEPFRPSVGVAVPPLRPKGTELSPSDTAMTPSRVGLPTPWGPLNPSGDVPDQEAVETRYGGAVAEVLGAGAFMRDMWKRGPGRGAGYDWLQRTWGPRVPPGTGSYVLTGSRPVEPLMSAYAGW